MNGSSCTELNYYCNNDSMFILTAMFVITLFVITLFAFTKKII